MNLDGLDPAILVPALAAGVLVIATHVPLGQQVLKRGIIFIDLAIAQIAGLGVLLANTLGLQGSIIAVQLTAFGAALVAGQDGGQRALGLGRAHGVRAPCRLAGVAAQHQEPVRVVV